ncbi:MAG: hypothetical protein D3910_06810, partial [Candidatus Electrothrix sp. ATG2]|nr:hypothetical protein [Candidatus Electrothrix sp. ATG2]
YRSAENIAQALQQGLLSMLRQKVEHFGGELEKSMSLLEPEPVSANKEELGFMRQRVQRAKKLQGRLDSILGNPLVRLLAKMNNS